MKEFLSHVNSLRPTIQFTLQTETGNSLPFLDILMYRNGAALLAKVNRKPTHTLAAIFISIPTILLMLKEEWYIVSSTEQQPYTQKSKSMPNK
jgi:hypothetical protein